jgi:hypothetical protein
MRAEKLKELSFYNNNIMADGCLAFVKADWPKISAIKMGNANQR